MVVHVQRDQRCAAWASRTSDVSELKRYPRVGENERSDGSLKVRILTFVPDGHPTFRPDVVSLLGKYLPRSGISVDIVAQATSTTSPRAVWDGGVAHLCATSRYAPLRKFKFLSYATLVGLGGAARRCDLLQVRDSPLMGVMWLAASRILRKPFAYWMSYPMSEDLIERAERARASGQWPQYWSCYLRGSLGKWLLYRVVLQFADHIFVQSNKMAQDVNEHGIPIDKMTPVVMGVDADDIGPNAFAGKRPDSMGNRRIVVYLGTLARARGLDFLIDVHRVISKVRADVGLLLVGDADHPEDRAWLESRVRDAGFQNSIVITGWLPRGEALAYVKGADVAVSPFKPSFLLDSCSPTKLVEYLALGKAVVASAQPDQAKVVEESGAGYCVPHDVERFAAAIIRLLDEPATRRKMEERGPGYVMTHRSYDVIAQNLSETYRQVAARWSTRGSVVKSRRTGLGDRS